MSSVEKLLFSEKKILLWDILYDNEAQLKTLAGVCITLGKLEGKKKSKTPEVDLRLRGYPPNPSFGGNAVQVSDAAIIINTSLIFILFIHPVVRSWASQVVLVVKNPSANAGGIRDESSIPEMGRSPGGGHGNPLQYSCLENPMDRGTWWSIVHRVTQSGM